LTKFPSSLGRFPSRLLSSRFLFTKGNNIGIRRWFIIQLKDKIKEAVSVFFIQSMEGRQVSQFDRNMAWQRVTKKIPANWMTQCVSAMKKQSCLNDNSSKHCWNHVYSCNLITGSEVPYRVFRKESVPKVLGIGPPRLLSRRPLRHDDAQIFDLEANCRFMIVLKKYVFLTK
jgi:hypothetical protein